MAGKEKRAVTNQSPNNAGIVPHLPCCTSDLLLFTPPPLQFGIEETLYQPFFPIAGVHNSLIEFSIQNLQKAYLDLIGSFIKITARIVRDDDEPMDEGDVVFPVNHLLSGLFKTVNVFANDKQVSSNELYSIRSILDVMLHSSVTSQQTYHSMGLYVEDEAGKQEDVTARGPKERFEVTKEGRYFNLVGFLNSDLFQQPRLLLPGVDLRLVFVQQPEAYRLIAPKKDKKYDYEIEIKEMILYIKKVTVAPSIFLSHEKTLQTKPAVYVLRGVETKLRSLSVGDVQAHCENIFPDRIPSKLCVLLVSTANLQGSSSTSPYNFRHFDLTHAVLTINERQIREEFEFDKGLVRKPYFTFLEELGEKHVKYSYEKYSSDGFMLYYNLDGCSGSSCLSTVSHGNVRLQLRFGKPLTDPLTIVFVSECPKLMKIDKDRNVSVE